MAKRRNKNRYEKRVERRQEHKKKVEDEGKKLTNLMEKEGYNELINHRELSALWKTNKAGTYLEILPRDMYNEVVKAVREKKYEYKPPLSSDNIEEIAWLIGKYDVKMVVFINLSPLSYFSSIRQISERFALYTGNSAIKMNRGDYQEIILNTWSSSIEYKYILGSNFEKYEGIKFYMKGERQRKPYFRWLMEYYQPEIRKMNDIFDKYADILLIMLIGLLMLCIGVLLLIHAMGYKNDYKMS